MILRILTCLALLSAAWAPILNRAQAQAQPPRGEGIKIEGLRLQLVAAGHGPGFGDIWTPEAQRQSVRAFQVSVGLPVTGSTDQATVTALQRSTDATIARWNLRAYTHPAARTVQLIPMGMGLIPKRTPTGLGFRTPDGSATIDYAMAPPELGVKEIHARLASRAQVSLQRLTDEISVVETVAADRIASSRYERRGNSVVGWTFSYDPVKWPDGRRIAAAMSIPAQHSGLGGRSRSGSGFAVSLEGHIVTNAHVVSGCDEATVSRMGEMRVIARDEETDLAVLARTPSSGSPIPPIALRSTRVKLGEAAYALGFPLGGSLGSGLNFTNGIVSALTGLRGDERNLQFTSPIQPGSSGGPLLDSTGAVIGVIVAKFDDGEMFQSMGQMSQNLNFAVRPDTLASFLRRAGVAFEPAREIPGSDPTAVAEFGENRTVQVVCKP